MGNPEIAKVVSLEDSELRRVREILFGKQTESLELRISEFRNRIDGLEKLISEMQNEKVDRTTLADIFSKAISLLEKEPVKSEPLEHGKRSAG